MRAAARGNRRDQTSQIIGHGGGEEPAAHRHTHLFLRCELGHHREPDRRQAELGHRVQHVGERQEQPEHFDAVGRVVDGRCQHQKAKPRADQGDGEFPWNGGIDPARLQRWPQHGKQRRVDQDEQRIGGLEQREVERGIHKVTREKIERGARLLEQRPEQAVGHEEHQHGDVALQLDAIPGTQAAHYEIGHQQQHQPHHHVAEYRALAQQEVDERHHEQRPAQYNQHGLQALTACGRFADVAQQAGTELEHHDPEDHANAGSQETVLVTESRADDGGAENGRKKGTGIDAHVEDRESGIAARIARTVKSAHHGRDIGFEQSVARHDHRQAHQKPLQVRDQQHEHPRRHQGAAQQYGALVPEVTIGKETAENAGGIDHGGVTAVSEARLLVGLALRKMAEEGIGDIDGQQGAHAVEAEALPEFGAEEHPQGAWMTEDLPGGGASHSEASSRSTAADMGIPRLIRGQDIVGASTAPAGWRQIRDSLSRGKTKEPDAGAAPG